MLPLATLLWVTLSAPDSRSGLLLADDEQNSSRPAAARCSGDNSSACPDAHATASQGPQPAAGLETRGEEPVEVGSRVGLVTVGGLTTAGALMAGIGVRYGLRERTDAELSFSPAFAVVAGADYLWVRGAFSPWLEIRAEVGATRPGGLLVHTFHGYLSNGLAVSPAGQVVPYWGIGTGWNWTGGLKLWDGVFHARDLGSLLATILVMPFVTAFACLGRAEVRMSIDRTGISQVQLMLGVGS